MPPFGPPRLSAHKGWFPPLGMHTTPSIPTLESLHTKPTWHNRAGRIDRSACFVLTVSKHWRDIPEDDWTYRLGLPPSEQWRLNNPRPAHDVRGLKGLCDRYAEATFWARALWLLHKGEQPYPLRGDFRTAKSNAMKAGAGAQWMREDRVLGDGPVNPNRGVGFNQYKMLGLDAAWHTTVRIERVVQHAKLRQHFFVCPVCGPLAAAQRAGVETERHASKTLPPARCAAAKKQSLPGRVTKLYLPLCTPREGEDAMIAQLWLKTHTKPNHPLTPDEAKLIERYGALFEPRQLRCRQCLGLRYGEVKKA